MTKYNYIMAIYTRGACNHAHKPEIVTIDDALVGINEPAQDSIEYNLYALTREVLNNSLLDEWVGKNKRASYATPIMLMPKSMDNLLGQVICTSHSAQTIQRRSKMRSVPSHIIVMDIDL